MPASKPIPHGNTPNVVQRSKDSKGRHLLLLLLAYIKHLERIHSFFFSLINTPCINLFKE